MNGAPADGETSYPVYKIHSSEKAHDYLKDVKVGEGTYAVVYKGTRLSTGEKIAIKKIKSGQFKDGLDLSAIREIKFLQEISHPNIVRLIDVMYHKMNLHLILEFLDTNLEIIIKDKSLIFTPANVKSWILMTCRGLYHCHKNWILHRDLKPNNLLIASNGELKLADFGLAREFGEPFRPMSSQVVTRWYRAPELLFGARSYGGNVDMWSVGVLLAELLLRTPFLAGESDIDQLNKTFQALGTPTEKDWPGLSKLPDYTPFKEYPRTPFTSLFSAATPDTLDFIEKLLLYDPCKRLSAQQALEHPYFSNLPRPTPSGELPKPFTPKSDDSLQQKKRKLFS